MLDCVIPPAPLSENGSECQTASPGSKDSEKVEEGGQRDQAVVYSGINFFSTTEIKQSQHYEILDKS